MHLSWTSVFNKYHSYHQKLCITNISTLRIGLFMLFLTYVHVAGIMSGKTTLWAFASSSIDTVRALFFLLHCLSLFSVRNKCSILFFSHPWISSHVLSFHLFFLFSFSSLLTILPGRLHILFFLVQLNQIEAKSAAYPSGLQLCHIQSINHIFEMAVSALPEIIIWWSLWARMNGPGWC